MEESSPGVTLRPHGWDEPNSGAKGDRRHLASGSSNCAFKVERLKMEVKDEPGWK